MRAKRVFCVIVAVVAATLVGPHGADAAGLSSPYTALTIAGSDQSSVFAGNLAFDPSNATMNGGFWPDGALASLTLSATYNRRTYTVDVSPPAGAGWSVGTTYDASNSPTSGQADFQMTGNEACSVNNASLTVLQTVVDPGTGYLTAFAASYKSTCDSSTKILSGEIRYNSTVGYVATSSDVASINPCCQYVGETGDATPITFTGAGSTSTTFGPAVIGGATPAAFSISSDTCSGSTLAYAATCVLDVAAHPTALGDQTAVLTIPDNSTGGQKVIALDVTGNDPHAVTVSPTSFTANLDVDQPGAPETVKIEPNGSQPVTFGHATIGGDTSAYSISDDTCSTKTVSLNQTCSITVIPHPLAAGTADAALSIPDNSAAGTEIVSLTGTAHAGRAGMFTPISKRIVDTRSGIGAPKAALGAGKTLPIRIMTGGAIPTSGVSAVVLNVTGIAPTASTFLTAYPAGATRPTASNVNLAAGRTVANMVTVKVGAGGYVDLYNAAGSLQIVVDTVGYYSADDTNPFASGDYVPVTPTRLLDTRTAQGGALQGRQEVALPIDFGASVNSHIKAVAVNITAVGPAAAGYLSSNVNPAAASTLNFIKGATVPNMAIVPVFTCTTLFAGCASLPAVTVYNGSASPVNVLVDIVGVYDDGTLPGGSRFFPINPTRIVDTRSGLGTKALRANSAAAVTTPSGVLSSVAGLFEPTYSGLDLNVTAVAPTAATFLTVWRHGAAKPTVSNLNPASGQTVANSVFTGANAAMQFDIYNQAGTTNVIVDVAGVFEVYPSGPATPFTAVAGTPVRKIVTP